MGLQITALGVLLKLAQQDENKRHELIKRGALGVACKLLREDAKGPQRKVSTQILLELSVEESSHQALMCQYNVVPILTKLLFVKKGLKDKNRCMIAQTLALLGNCEEHRATILGEINNTLDSMC